jgi:hypothetical protein
MANQVPKKSKFIRTIILFIRKWNEAIILFPIAIISWMVIPYLLRMIDPTTAVYDSGVLMKFMYANVGVVVCHFTGWLMLRLTMPRVFQYIYIEMPWDLYAENELTASRQSTNESKCKRIKYSILLLSIYFFVWIAILATI